MYIFPKDRFKAKFVLELSLSLFLTFLLVGCVENQQQTLPTNTFSGTTSTITASATYTNLVSTTGTSTPTVTVVSTETWEQGWLKGIPCFLPCWEGITAGQTKSSEAMELLKKNPLITNVKFFPEQPVVNNSKDQGSIIWDILGRPSNKIYGNGNGGALDYKISNQIIYSIIPYFNESYKFSEIQKVYGEPSHIIATVGLNERGYSYRVEFIYLTKGLNLLLHLDSYNTKPILSLNSTLENPIFFQPTLEGYKQAFSFNPNIMVKWEGFKPFDYYCRELYSDGKVNCN